MENVDAEISMDIGALMFSMEFNGKCPNPPWKYFPWKSMEKFPWNSMEIDVLILHGIPWRIFHGNPWNSMEVFHTGIKSKLKKKRCAYWPQMSMRSAGVLLDTILGVTGAYTSTFCIQFFANRFTVRLSTYFLCFRFVCKYETTTKAYFILALIELMT